MLKNKKKIVKQPRKFSKGSFKIQENFLKSKSLKKMKKKLEICKTIITKSIIKIKNVKKLGKKIFYNDKNKNARELVLEQLRE